ncbi:hypothetical protein F5Y06DRAFT_284609 [Hypoxylon sp. FL0890]|nr:hypothetical protein F5Y06DRAFT_284609 [Hypoxylon sp. FL0890]
MNITCAPQTTKSLRRPRQVKPESAVPAKRGQDGHFTKRQPSYGHVIIGLGPFGFQSENGASTESRTSSPASPRRESPPRNAPTTTTLTDSIRAPESVNVSPCRPPQLLPALPTNKPSQPGFGLTWSQAEQAVYDFRTKFTPFFPFVVLDPDVSAQTILSKKPLLFRAIMLVAAQLNLAKQREITRSILAYIGHRILLLEERGLGLLQGLMVFIAWCEPDFYWDQRITSLTYLAMGYAHNLAITRPPPTMQQKLLLAINPKDVKEAMLGHSFNTVLEESHTPEEQRAFLGCQYLLSMNSSQFGRDGVLKGDYVNHCLNSLVRPTDFGADFILDKMIRFQQIVEQISEKLAVPSNVDGTRVFTISMSNEMQSIRNQLDQLFANMAREHRQFVLFWAMHNCVLVRLYLPASNLSRPTDEVAAHHQQQCMLYCLQAARSFFATVLSMGQEAFLFRTFASFSDMLFVLVAASRLLLVEIEGWDLEAARQTLDLPATLQGLISIFRSMITLRNQRAAEAAATFGVDLTPDTSDDEKNDRFSRYAAKLEWIKNWFEAQLSRGPGVLGEPHPCSGPSNWAPENQAWNPFMFGFLGDPNWNIEF